MDSHPDGAMLGVLKRRDTCPTPEIRAILLPVVDLASSGSLGLQLFDEKFAKRFEFDVLDATKMIPEEDVPIRRVGRLVLDRCMRRADPPYTSAR